MANSLPTHLASTSLGTTGAATPRACARWEAALVRLGDVRTIGYKNHKRYFSAIFLVSSWKKWIWGWGTIFFFQTHVRKSCNVRGVEQEMRGKLQNTPGFDHQEWASMRPKMGFSFNKNHQPKLDIKKCSFPAPWFLTLTHPSQLMVKIVESVFAHRRANINRCKSYRSTNMPSWEINHK